MLSTLIPVVPATAVFAADAYPSKPIRLIIPFPPGERRRASSGVWIAGISSESLGKPVVVDNRGGAGGVLGSEMAAKASPDGYTLLIISAAYGFNPALYKLPFDPVKSLSQSQSWEAGRTLSPQFIRVFGKHRVKGTSSRLRRRKPGQLIPGCHQPVFQAWGRASSNDGGHRLQDKFQLRAAVRR